MTAHLNFSNRTQCSHADDYEMYHLSEIIREINVNKNRIYSCNVKEQSRERWVEKEKSNSMCILNQNSTLEKGPYEKRLKTNNPLNCINERTNERTTKMSEMNEVDVTSVVGSRMCVFMRALNRQISVCSIHKMTLVCVANSSPRKIVVNP